MHHALALIVAMVAQASAQDIRADPEIVITGRRLSDTERALADCMRRKCPPDEDMKATLAHAENLFISGDYDRARATTLASLGRNRKMAATYPVPVSDLQRANARIAAHLGEGDDYQSSTFGIRRALVEGLAAGDPRLVGAHLEVGDMLVSMGQARRARLAYDQMERDALKIDRRDLAALARLRVAWIDYLEGRHANAMRKLRLIAASTDARERTPRLAAMVLLARIDRKDGKFEASEALIRELAMHRPKQPMLLYTPPLQLASAASRDGGSVTARMATDSFEDRWVDIGFWVKPDGRTADVEILRESGATQWAMPLLAALKGRVYSANGSDAGDGVYRVERYSYTSFYEVRLGSRIRERSGDARVEFLDLTTGPTPKSR